ncbi:MAG TPA: class II fructose-bisphosphatase [Methyloceanibacter sp.]|jgi:fructose-1,6-bisphosphatase II / sedoheptulose-1,7-bisphosphatase
MSSAKAALELIPAFDIVRFTEAAAVAAARLRGCGDEAAADEAAALAMYQELEQLPFAATVVVGEGEQGETPHLYIGETIGARGAGAPVELAVDPIEGSTLCAKDLPNALAVIAIAEPGSFLKVPDIYMDKIAIGPGFEDGLVDLDASPKENLERLAKAKGVKLSEITACILDRSRHGRLIEAVRQAGAAIRLIGDGDITGVIHTTEPQDTGIDIYLGVGGAPEGVLAAAALSCIGGQMQGRLMASNAEQRERAAAAGIKDFNRKYSIPDMVSGDVRFAATGITDGSLLEGVRFTNDLISTHTVTMRSRPRTTRWIRTEHRDVSKFA